MTALTRLRPVREDELVLLATWAGDLSSVYDDFTGDPPPRVAPRPPAKPTGFGQLMVADAADQAIGSVSWHEVAYGPGPGSLALNLGISLRPPARGHGHGARAQRLLADHLFVHTAVHRVEASTDVTNLAEQGALLRAGFAREGVLRGAQWRRGAFHDLVVFSRLRSDA